MYAVYSEIRDKKGLKDSDVAKGTGVSNQRLSHFLLKFQLSSKKVQRKVSTCGILSVSVFTFFIRQTPDAIRTAVSAYSRVFKKGQTDRHSYPVSGRDFFMRNIHSNFPVSSAD